MYWLRNHPAGIALMMVILILAAFTLVLAIDDSTADGNPANCSHGTTPKHTHVFQVPEHYGVYYTYVYPYGHLYAMYERRNTQGSWGWHFDGWAFKDCH